MFDRKLTDHLVIGDLDALVGGDATLIAAMTIMTIITMSMRKASRPPLLRR